MAKKIDMIVLVDYMGLMEFHNTMEQAEARAVTMLKSVKGMLKVEGKIIREEKGLALKAVGEFGDYEMGFITLEAVTYDQDEFLDKIQAVKARNNEILEQYEGAKKRLTKMVDGLKEMMDNVAQSETEEN